MQHPPTQYSSEVLCWEHKLHTFTSILLYSFPKGGQTPQSGTSQSEQGRAHTAPQGGGPPKGSETQNPTCPTSPTLPQQTALQFTFPEAASVPAHPR